MAAIGTLSTLGQGTAPIFLIRVYVTETIINTEQNISF